VLKLIIEDDEGRKTVVPFVRDEITIGRQEGNTIRLTERNVSRRHARLVRQSGTILVEDLGSYNGVRVNGERVAGQAAIQDGDLIQIGDYDLALKHDANRPTPPRTSTSDLDVTPPRGIQMPRNGAAGHARPSTGTATPEARQSQTAGPAANGADTASRQRSTSIIQVREVHRSNPRSVRELSPDEAPRLVALNTDLAGREFQCTLTELRIGRTPENDISLDHRSLSRCHAKLLRDDSGEWRVIDLQSANGLTVNGERYAQATVSHLDTIELGHLKLKFVAAGRKFSMAPGATESKTGGRKLPAVIGLGATLAFVAGAAAFLVLPGTHAEKGQPVRARPAGQPHKTSPAAPAARVSASAEANPEQKQEPHRDAIQKPASVAATSESPAAEGPAADSPTPSAAAQAEPANPSPPSATNEARKLYDEGVALLTRKQNREARAVLSRCVEIDSSFAPCHLMLGSAAARLGQPDVGARHYETFLRLSPTAQEAPKVRAFLEDYKYTRKRDSN
jgi:ABC transport system ATP-binding/permease protein